MASLRLFSLLIIIYGLEHVQCYKPVIFMHGIFSNGGTSKQIFQWINEGTDTFAVTMFEGLKSAVSLNKQVKKIGKWLEELMKNYTAGINLICFSQGGQVCRGLVERLDHNIDTFVALSAPLGGQFGLTKSISKLFPKWVKEDMYKIAYTIEGQLISAANYWNDPHHRDLYRKYSEYLAYLNNDRMHNRSQEYKRNFTKLKKLVLIGGPDDGVIQPWQSSQFGFYNEDMKVENMTGTPWFKDDTFGLQTLYNRGDIVNCTFGGIHHSDWYLVKPVFEKCILPFLK